MNRKVEMFFPNKGVTIVAEMLEEEAPKTCNAIWHLLPTEGEAVQGIYSGSEVYINLPQEVKIDPENQTNKVIPGDVCYYCLQGKHLMGIGKNLYQICLFYGRDAEPQMPWGPIMLNVFAKVVSPLNELSHVCKQIRFRGTDKVIIKRKE